jgi:integrase
MMYRWPGLFGRSGADIARSSPATNGMMWRRWLFEDRLRATGDLGTKLGHIQHADQAIQPNTAWVAPSVLGDSAHTPDSSFQWRAARSASGFDWVTPKTFRKTVATLLARERSTKAAAQLGHSGTTVTRQHYIKKGHRATDNSTILQALAPRPSNAPSPMAM